MPDRVARTLLIGAILLGTVWIGGDMVRDLVLSADTPRAVAARGSLAEYERQTMDIFRQVSPSVAYIFTESAVQPFLGARAELRQGAGSGFIWDGAGHVVTNNHVVEGAARVAVRVDAGEAIPARIVGVAPAYDLAVLKLDRVRGVLKPIPVGMSSDLQIGQAVFAIGNPFGLSRTLTTGVVSALDRRLPTSAGREIAGVIQTDAAINPGNSGGPLLDSAGRLVGVTTAILSESGASAGIGFAVPVDVVNRIVPRLIKDGRVPRPGIGIHAASEELVARLGIPGVVIAHVVTGSSAARAGLIAIDYDAGRLGDVITHVDGEPVRSVAELVHALARAGVGASVVLTVVRDGRSRSVELDVADISRGSDSESGGG